MRCAVRVGGPLVGSWLWLRVSLGSCFCSGSGPGAGAGSGVRGRRSGSIRRLIPLRHRKYIDAQQGVSQIKVLLGLQIIVFRASLAESAA